MYARVPETPQKNSELVPLPGRSRLDCELQIDMTIRSPARLQSFGIFRRMTGIGEFSGPGTAVGLIHALRSALPHGLRCPPHQRCPKRFHPCSSTTAFQINIGMNTNRIISRAAEIGVSTDALGVQVAAHEFGHVLGIDDLQEAPSTCDAINSVMDSAPSNRALCAYSSPQGGCDYVRKASKYPSVVPQYCTSGCDLNTSC